MYASPNPCTPQGHHRGWRRRRDLKDHSRRKAPTGPVLKDRSWVNSPMGGYGRSLDCSHCPVAALATVQAAQEQKETKGWIRNSDTRPNPMALRQALVPASAPTGKNATFERGTCHSGAPGPVAKMPLPATAVATAHRDIPASPTVHCRAPVERDFPPFQLRTSYEIPDWQKCHWRPTPVHPKGITQGVSNLGACRPPHMCGLMGGYAGDSGGSNSLAALATPPPTQTDTR